MMISSLLVLNTKKFYNKCWKFLSRKTTLIFTGLLIVIVYASSAPTNRKGVNPGLIPGMQGFLVKNERCIIPDIDPFHHDAMQCFHRQKIMRCSLLKPLTGVEYNATTRRYHLKVIKERTVLFTNSETVDCCYQTIERNSTKDAADYKVVLSKCIYFQSEVQLAPTIHSILVKCEVNGKEVYKNGHPMIPERSDVRDRINKWKSKDVENQQNATGVLLIGIDSMSRLNFMRTMPKTARYLHENEWFEMAGYNKIEDNTFPNLIAVLTGFSFETIEKLCDIYTSKLDNCSSIIWNIFHEHGYVTAYGEDYTDINTFTLYRRGFVRQPVDYYLRPFLLAAEENLYIKRRLDQIRCLGYKDYSDFIFDYAKELVMRFRHSPYFGLFWMNSFSHKDFSEPSSMDEHIADSMRSLMSLIGHDNTIVVFFSDHGIRFGQILGTLSGYYEERLPLMFVWLPTQLRKSHPEIVNALKVNKNRLTNPYDLHMTLKHVLALSKRVTEQERLAATKDCPLCQSLFAPVPDNRSCDDIAITQHYCTCVPYKSALNTSKTVHTLVKMTIDYINRRVIDFQGGEFCETLSLSTIDTVYRTLSTGRTKGDEFYRLNFYTKPNQGFFGATVRFNELRGDFEVIDKISRLNSYRNDSYCVPAGELSKFCACRKNK